MSGDEVLALIAALFVILITWIQWLSTALKIDRFHPSRSTHAVVGGSVVAAAVLLFVALRLWASWDVRDSTLYTAFYLFIGAAFIGGTLLLLAAMGLSLRDDVLERFNPAATITIAGTILGSTTAFAGANIGDGPGWWVVIFCALLSNGAMLTGWVILDRLVGTGEAITVDRDRATAWRAAGWFTASGIIFGRGAAGNWTSVEAAIQDFLKVGVGGWVLLTIVVAAEYMLRPRNSQRTPLLAGLLPAVIYLCGALAYVILLYPL